MVRLAGSLLGVFAFWVVIWLPLVLVETSAAEPGEQILGDPDAPVTLIEYASLTCPHCAQFHTEVLPDLKERYIATGKVRLIYRDFPLDERALMAAALAHCAGPDRYFGFLDVLFETQSSWARAEDYLGALKKLGKLGGMSDEQMDQCLADDELTNAHPADPARRPERASGELDADPGDQRRGLCGRAQHRGAERGHRSAARQFLSAAGSGRGASVPRS